MELQKKAINSSSDTQRAWVHKLNTKKHTRCSLLFFFFFSRVVWYFFDFKGLTFMYFCFRAVAIPPFPRVITKIYCSEEHWKKEPFCIGQNKGKSDRFKNRMFANVTEITTYLISRLIDINFYVLLTIFSSHYHEWGYGKLWRPFWLVLLINSL